MKKWGMAATLLLILFILGTCVWYLYQSRGKMPAAAFGGQSINILLADNYAYQQRDPKWKDIHLATNPKAGTLGEVGCTVSSIAVALSNLGYVIDPEQLNGALSQNEGFNERGWLIWSALEKATNGKAKAQAYSSPSRKQVDACLSEGRYPIVKYLIGGVVQHWVTVVGKQDGTYLIRDPLMKGDKPEALHHHTPVILSLRCVGLNKTMDDSTNKNSTITDNIENHDEK